MTPGPPINFLLQRTNQIQTTLPYRLGAEQYDPATMLSAPAEAQRIALGSGMPAPDSFDTKLTPQEEQQFQQWKLRYAPRDSGADYDLRGAFKAGLKPDPMTGHWPDTFKKPNHPTFSTQSQYAKFAPGQAGTWDREGPDAQYIPPAQNLLSWREHLEGMKLPGDYDASNDVEGHKNQLRYGKYNQPTSHMPTRKEQEESGLF